MKYRETMRAEHAPDVYGGPACDQHLPRWVGSAEGDRDGPGPIGEELVFDAKVFPPGTLVKVFEPVCPHCHEVPVLMPELSSGWKCGCDFNWKDWADDRFS